MSSALTDESCERDVIDYSLAELISRSQLLLDRAEGLLLARIGLAKRSRMSFNDDNVRDAIKLGGVSAVLKALETVQ